jgi:hypothetical protein
MNDVGFSQTFFCQCPHQRHGDCEPFAVIGPRGYVVGDIFTANKLFSWHNKEKEMQDVFAGNILTL